MAETHPLDILTDDEIRRAVTVIRFHFTQTLRASEIRFCQLGLNEPSKQQVTEYEQSKETDVRYLVFVVI